MTSSVLRSINVQYSENIHTSWFGDWSLLEDHHGYIQWLFPIFESNGMNSKSEKLTPGEAKLIREDLSCAKRVVVSYRLMLNFYGFKLINEETGELERDEESWKGRFHNLNTHGHNNLRISRILQSLGQLGFRRYKQPLALFFKEQIEEHDELPHCKRSLNQYWMPLLDESSADYARKTLETSEDRTESVYFSYLVSQKAKKAEDQKPPKDKGEVELDSIVTEKTVNNPKSME